MIHSQISEEKEEKNNFIINTLPGIANMHATSIVD
jgi:hypothetical protein